MKYSRLIVRKGITRKGKEGKEMEKRSINYYTLRNIDRLPQYQHLPDDDKFALRVVGNVLPFRVNSYVIDELIDWNAIPDDPIYRLTFMHRDMLRPEQFDRMADVIRCGADRHDIEQTANAIRSALNPHPAGQLTRNVPVFEGELVPGIQHKYGDTCLVFPRNGQTCHSYCTFCFRWPQFVGTEGFKFATDESRRFQAYLNAHREVSDVLFTGGDPMVMNASNLEAYILPLLHPDFEHIRTIRIGTKSVAYWPFRYVTDPDADRVLKLFSDVVRSGKQLALMAHFTHWREIETPVAREAIRRIRSTGAVVRTQCPIVRRINDDPSVWSRMWTDQVSLGCFPYYMFVERDTGPNHYFSVPLVRATEIYAEAMRGISGLARTARGPVMSTYYGKVCIDGVAVVHGERVFALRFLRARNPAWNNRPFFARFDARARWLSDLKPAFGSERFFFEAQAHDREKRTHGFAQPSAHMNHAARPIATNGQRNGL